jgi:site-specific DNA recombinase
MTKAISYGRVSDAGQATGKSVDNQLSACREYADKKDMEIVGEYRDDGKSGTSLHTRNGAMDALTAIAEGGIDYLLVTETDRIARNSEENYIIRKHLKKHKCKLVAVNQSYTEGESEETDLIIGIMSNIDEFFSKINGKKTKRGMVKKIERGEWPNAAPIGYKNMDIGTEEKHHYVVRKDDVTAPLVKEALELFSTGSFTAVKLRDIMHERGLRSRKGKRIPKSSFIHMLKKLVLLRNDEV